MSLRHRLAQLERHLAVQGTAAAYAEADEQLLAALEAADAGDFSLLDRGQPGPPGWLEARLREAAALEHEETDR